METWTPKTQNSLNTKYSNPKRSNQFETLLIIVRVEKAFIQLLFWHLFFTGIFACAFTRAVAGAIACAFTRAFTGGRFKNANIAGVLCVDVWICWCFFVLGILFSLLGLFGLNLFWLNWLWLLNRFYFWDFFIFTYLVGFFIHWLIKMSSTGFSSLALYFGTGNRLTEHWLFKVVE